MNGSQMEGAEDGEGSASRRDRDDQPGPGSDESSTAGSGLVALVRRAWREWVVLPFAEEDARCQRLMAERKPGPDWVLIGVFLVSALGLTGLEYFGKSQYYWQWIHAKPVAKASFQMLDQGYANDPGSAHVGWYFIRSHFGAVDKVAEAESEFRQLMYWASWCFASYFLLPAAYARFVMKKRLRDLGLNFRGLRRHFWVYLLFFAVLLPILYVVSQDGEFQDTYPFFHGAALLPTSFLIWELAYAVQFFSLEFFFRGFMVHGLRDRLGAYSVLAMMVPYCLIHFGKPLPETLGAIIAGTILGLLALRTGSIFLGFLVHVSVAWSMDLMSLWHQKRLAGIFERLF